MKYNFMLYCGSLNGGWLRYDFFFFFLSVFFSLLWCIGLADWLVEEFGGRAVLHSTVLG